MKTETLVGVGVGLLVGWLLWRRRGLMSMPVSVGGCSGCSGGSGSSTLTAAGAAPGGCAQRLSAGIGDFRQQTGPTLQGWGSI
jgi:hypothetical protein